MLRNAGLRTLPGTAAEILDDGIRKIICPDKLTPDIWLDVIASAHGVGLRTTAQEDVDGHGPRPQKAASWPVHAYLNNDRERP
jgi:FO synthase